ncbi:MAG TPA: PilZ domain-containing protein [Mariprofundaceae bacterium]|nr:PilZ domain-containing protein [Mariprofundaceae bacterium]
MEDQARERRSYERFPVELDVEVYEFDSAQKQYLETASLRDISGGGARFSSSCPEKYRVGQRLYISIVLPDTASRHPSMQGKATVVWVGDTEDRAGDRCIGICMDDLLVFNQFSHSVADSGGGKSA